MVRSSQRLKLAREKEILDELQLYEAAVRSGHRNSLFVLCVKFLTRRKCVRIDELQQREELVERVLNRSAREEKLVTDAQGVDVAS